MVDVVGVACVGVGDATAVGVAVLVFTEGSGVALRTSGLRPPRPREEARLLRAAGEKGRSRWSMRAAAVPGEVMSRLRSVTGGVAAGDGDGAGLTGVAGWERGEVTVCCEGRGGSLRGVARVSLTGLTGVFAGLAGFATGFAVVVVSLAGIGRLFSGFPSSCFLVSCLVVLAAALFSFAVFFSRRCSMRGVVVTGGSLTTSLASKALGF